MKRQSFTIYARDGRDFFIFTIVFGPGATIAECDPVHFHNLETLERNLSSLVQSRLAASHSKSDITGDEQASKSFLKTVKVKTWNAFYRECVSISVRRDSRGYCIDTCHWDGRGFSSSVEDQIELPLVTSPEEVARHVIEVLKSVDKE